MPPRVARFLASIGLLAQGLFWCALAGWIFTVRNALAVARKAPDGDLATIYGLLNNAEPVIFAGKIAGCAGFGLLLLAVTYGRERARWIFWGGLFACLPLLVVFPIGTVLGVTGLFYFLSHGREFFARPMMMSALETAVGHAPMWGKDDGPGRFVDDGDGIQFADIAALESADAGSYQTCRGCVPQAALAKLVDILLDESGTYSEDEHLEAECEGLWDWITHQYTLYSVTPIFLDYALRRCRAVGRMPSTLAHLVAVCRRSGTPSIYLTKQEIELNRAGKLPIFRIEDVLKKHGCETAETFLGTPLR